MSTKIYEAYRIPTGKLNNFLASILPPTFDEAEKKVRFLMGSLPAKTIEKALNDANLYKMEFRDDEDRRWAALECLLKENHDNMWRVNPFDFENEWGIRIYNRFAYLIPVGNCTPKAGIILAIDGVQSYHFWDNTDRDEDVTSTAWWRRGEMWSKAFEQPRLSFMSVSFAPGCYESTAEIQKRLWG